MLKGCIVFNFNRRLSPLYQYKLSVRYEVTCMTGPKRIAMDDVRHEKCVSVDTMHKLLPTRDMYVLLHIHHQFHDLFLGQEHLLHGSEKLLELIMDKLLDVLSNLVDLLLSSLAALKKTVADLLEDLLDLSRARKLNDTSIGSVVVTLVDDVREVT